MANLTDYVLDKGGPWWDQFSADAYRNNRLMLAWNGDYVKLRGELRVRITFYADNITVGPNDEFRPHPHKVYSYVLHIPPNHTWEYRMQEGGELDARLGTNNGYDLVIEPAGAEIATEFIGPSETDIPCNFGVTDISRLANFFPSPCEPCPPGVSVGLPPGSTPIRAVPAAKGGCIRPRFFNGMFITSEDMETLLRWTRLKQQMQNRAMGQGVVWGLNVDRDGHHIRVHPGYAVDCCGHDLVVTTPYCVDISTLLRDPVAVPGLEGEGPHRMHLLLEYQECPEEPRPVHGDPCSPEVNRCEMSRIRETVRLRLVPPRDYRAEGPLNTFLQAIEAIVGEVPWLDSLFPDSWTGPVESELTEVPFRIEIGATMIEGDDPSEIESVVDWDSIRPSRTRAEVLGPVTGGEYRNLGVVYGSRNIRIRFIADPGQVFLGGAIRDAQNGQLVSVSFPTNTIEGVIQPDSPLWEEVEENRSWELAATYSIEELCVGTIVASDHAALTVISSTIEIHASQIRSVESITMVSATLTAQPAQMRVEAVEPTPWPCFSEACSGGEDPLFPAPPPWLYGDPLQPRPTDWRSVALTIVYRFLLWHLRNYRDGMPQPDVEEAWSAAGHLLRPFLNAFYNGAEDNGPLESGIDALRRLLCAWCESFLYPGPQCAEEPHGVVVGCVSIAGGDIVTINPWGGRRHVLHAPLLAHLGEQLGITAPDVLASRVMAMVCCLGGLRPSADVSSGHFSRVPEGLRAVFREMGIGAAQPIVARHVSLDFPGFVETAVRSLVRPSAVGPETRFVRYELADSPGISFIAPETGEMPETAGPTSDRERERVIISRHVEESAEDIPPLLEEAAIELTSAALDVFPIRIREENPVREPLLNARILTAGSVLRHAPSEIYTRIAASREPRAVNEVVNENRRLAAQIAHLITRSISRFSRDNEVVSPDELARDENRADFVDVVAEELRAAEGVPEVPTALVDAVVKRTLKRLVSRRE